MKKITILAIALMFVVTISKAQSIPNGNFENWSNPNGYNVPDGWETLNDMTSTASIYTATRGGISSDYFLKLTSQTVSGLGVMPGMAVSGKMNMNSLTAVSGFPFKFRPTGLTGNWQYMGNSSQDIGFIRVYLTNWDSGTGKRDTVAYMTRNLSGMVMSWTSFNLPLIYKSTNMPDSCIILLSASGPNPEAGSYLYVNNLYFAGTTTGGTNIESTGTFKVFPNPSNQDIQIDLSGLKATAQHFEITDLIGKVIATKQTDGSLLQTLSIGELPAGNYLLRISTAKGIVTQKISKQ
ncbi:MAG: T9SS type A sorting domain-containing protein [Bacteroidia bacterium]